MTAGDEIEAHVQQARYLAFPNYETRRLISERPLDRSVAPGRTGHTKA